MKSILKNFSFVLSITIMSLAVSYTFGAWTEPSVSPPEGNVSAPINVSSTGQTKSGALTVNADFTANRLIDTADGSYYIDPANIGTSALFAGKVGVGIINPDYKLDVDGIIRNGAVSASVAGEGWYRVAHIDGASGRGQNTVTVYTIGGSYAPRSTSIRWHKDWGAGAGISVISEQGGGYWSNARVTDDGTNSYLEVYFTTAIDPLYLTLNFEGGHQLGNLYSGTLPAGGDTVRTTTSLGKFIIGSGDLIVDDSGNIIADNTPTADNHVATKGYVDSALAGGYTECYSDESGSTGLTCNSGYTEVLGRHISCCSSDLETLTWSYDGLGTYKLYTYWSTGRILALDVCASDGSSTMTLQSFYCYGSPSENCYDGSVILCCK